MMFVPLKSYCFCQNDRIIRTVSVEREVEKWKGNVRLKMFFFLAQRKEIRVYLSSESHVTFSPQADGDKLT